MAVFENLKNFIRHGKAADKPRVPVSASIVPNELATTAASNDADTGAKHSSAGANNLAIDHVPSPGTPYSYDDAVKKIIAEENETRNKLPRYPGLERYDLMEKMGDGAFSVVFKAKERATGDLRAIKIVEKGRLNSSQKASVLKEAAIMRQLDHPNIVHMYSFEETSDHYFIVLDLVPGGELFHQIVKLTYFSEDLSRHVIIQVAQAVRYLHDVAGVVHRDIKPENLLFYPIDWKPSKDPVLRAGDDESKEDEGEFTPGVGGGGIGQIKLADFGLSKVVWNTKTMTPCGTVGYTAPEIVKDERYSKSVDMWALGCVLYTILCGFPPFYDESIECLTKKVAKGQYTFLSPWWDDMSTSSKDLISRLLTVNPEKRLTIDEFFQHPWITLDGTVPVETTEVAAHRGLAPLNPAERRFRDPAMDIALKDAFDVSNAVYRMENENPRGVTPAAIIEEDEDDDVSTSHVEHVPKTAVTLESLSLQDNVASAGQSQRTVQKTREREKERVRLYTPPANDLFDLKLEGATLLERRRRAKEPVAV